MKLFKDIDTDTWIYYQAPFFMCYTYTCPCNILKPKKTKACRLQCLWGKRSHSTLTQLTPLSRWIEVFLAE